MPPPSDNEPIKRVGRIKPFVPWATMYKIDTEPDADPRGLVCINCGAGISWKVFNIAPDVFNAACPTCKVTAANYYKDKVRKELPNGP